MKYLKTKYGIIDMSSYALVEENEYELVFRKTGQHAKKNTLKIYMKVQVEKTADNPKDLCDEFIIAHTKWKEPLIYIAPHEDKRIIENFEGEDVEIYGAIYVQKGRNKGYKLEPVCKLVNGSFVVLKD